MAHVQFFLLHENFSYTVSHFHLPENSSPTMSDLYNWLHPLKEVSSNDSSKSISSLMGVVKDHTPLLSVHRPGKANSPIITSLRILLTYVRPSAYGSSKGKIHSIHVLLHSTTCTFYMHGILLRYIVLKFPYYDNWTYIHVHYSNNKFKVITHIKI